MNSLVGRIAARYLSAATPLPAEDIEPPSPGEQIKHLSLPGLTPYETWLDLNKVLKKPQWRTLTFTMETKLRKGLGLGITSPAWQFFRLADHVLHMSLGAPREDLFQQFKMSGTRLARVVLDKFGDVVGAEVAGAVHNFVAENRSNLMRIVNPKINGVPFTQIGMGVSQVVEKIAKAMDVQAGALVKPMGSGKWPQIRLLTRKENELQKLQENNPELYQEIKQRADALTPDEQLEQSGLVRTTVSIEGVQVPAGVDPVTGERFFFPVSQPPVEAKAPTYYDRAALEAQNELGRLRDEDARYDQFLQVYREKNRLNLTTPDEDAEAKTKEEDALAREDQKDMLSEMLKTRRSVNVVSEADYRRDRAKYLRSKGVLLTEFAPMTTFKKKVEDGKVVTDKDGQPVWQAEPVRNPNAIIIDGARRIDPLEFVDDWDKEPAPEAEVKPEGEAKPEDEKGKKPKGKTWNDVLKDVRIFPAMRKNGTSNEVQYRALTDNKAEIEGTRVYPVREDANGELVIIEGRFQGFHLDDMVNAAGRLVEGAAYDLNDEGIPVEFDALDEKGNLALNAVNKEPYCTLDSQGRFLLKIPMVRGGRGGDPFRMARERLASKASKRPFTPLDREGKPQIDDKTGKRKRNPGWTRGTIVELPMRWGEGRTLFTFEAKDFATVRASVGGFCMSAAAAEKLREYNSQLARQEAALKKENLDPFDLYKLGGFNTQLRIDPKTGEPTDPPVLTKDLMSKQKEALAWVEAKGYKGLAALDTGVGKTLLTIATIKKMIRDGAAGDLKFLYVCPKLLLNNFVSEMKAWLTKEANDELTPRIVQMSYEDFAFEVMGGERNTMAPKEGSGVKRRVKNSQTGLMEYQEDETTRKLVNVREAVPELDKDGKTIPVLDAGGNPVLDDKGKPRIKLIQRTDDKGNPLFDSNGSPVYKMRNKKESKGRNLAFAKQFAAIFFDEAHYLTQAGENSQVSQAAQLINHPRKILLTASPMDDDPDALYTSVAITNNQIVSSGWDRDPVTGDAVEVKGKKISQARKELMAFRRRFCVRVAGRTLGIKSDNEADPTARQDFDAWAKDGMYFADKRTIGVEGTSDYEQTLKLPGKMDPETVCLNMHPDIEEAYRATAMEVANILKALVKVFKMTPEELRQTGRGRSKALTEAEKALTTNYESKLKKHIKLLEQLVNYPEEVRNPDGTYRFEKILSDDPRDILSPKIKKALEVVRDHIGKKRVVLFTDDPKMAKKTGQALVNNLSGCRVGVALKDRITVFEARPALPAGEQPTVKTGADETPVKPTAKVHRPEVYTSREPYKTKDGADVTPEKWASHVLEEIISKDPTIQALVLTKDYALGQNLQSFGTVVHLDRDTFSNEMMKQRLARVWRTNQKSQVDEYMLDVTYSAPGKDDYTLDQVRSFIQSSQENLFEDIVMDSRMAVIGEDWKTMKETQASMVEVNRQMLELMFAPYPEALGDYKLQQATLAQKMKGTVDKGKLPPAAPLPTRFAQ